MSKTATKRILIVDDEEDLVDMAKRKLERNGYYVDVAYNGKEGIDKVQSDEYDLIVTDVVMPIMDGFTFYKQLKDDSKTSDIPVIILTARSNMEGSFRALGVNDFLAKPFDGGTLLDKIESFIREPVIAKKKTKVFLVGEKVQVVSEMSQILRDYNCQTEIISDPFDVIKKSYELQPDIILIDVLLDGLKTKEIIHSIRSFGRLKNVKIIIYTHFTPQQMTDVKTIDQLKDSKDECMIAGATKYIGRYTMVSFMDSLREYML